MYIGQVNSSDDTEALSSELVVQAARMVRAVRRAVDQPVGVRVLSLLDEYGELSVTELAEADRCSQPTMSGTVSSLLANGWVTKEADPRDARRSVVRLTAQGSEQLRAFRTEVGAIIADRFRHSARHDTADLEVAIDVLRELLGTDNAPSPKRGTL